MKRHRHPEFLKSQYVMEENTDQILKISQKCWFNGRRGYKDSFFQRLLDLHAWILPGFSYLGGLDERIHTPRLANPRIRIPAGSVGIGGSQTGIYPLDSPGGWQLLGLTPVKTYDPERENPILFEAGDYIRFVPVSEEEYLKIKEQVENGTYECIIHTKEV